MQISMKRSIALLGKASSDLFIFLFLFLNAHSPLIITKKMKHVVHETLICVKCHFVCVLIPCWTSVAGHCLRARQVENFGPRSSIKLVRHLPRHLVKRAYGNSRFPKECRWKELADSKTLRDGEKPSVFQGWIKQRSMDCCWRRNPQKLRQE